MCSLSLQPNVLYLWPESAENEYLPLFRDLRWQVTSLLPPTTTLQSPFLPFFPNSCPLNLTTTECMAHFGFSLMFRVRDTSTQILGGASMGVASLFWFYLFLTLRVCISQGEPKKKKQNKNKNKQKQTKKPPPGPETNTFWQTLRICTLFSSVHYTILMPTSMRFPFYKIIFLVNHFFQMSVNYHLMLIM